MRAKRQVGLCGAMRLAQASHVSVRLLKGAKLPIQARGRGLRVHEAGSPLGRSRTRIVGSPSPALSIQSSATLAMSESQGR